MRETIVGGIRKCRKRSVEGRVLRACLTTTKKGAQVAQILGDSASREECAEENAESCVEEHENEAEARIAAVGDDDSGSSGDPGGAQKHPRVRGDSSACTRRYALNGTCIYVKVLCQCGNLAFSVWTT